MDPASTDPAERESPNSPKWLRGLLDHRRNLGLGLRTNSARHFRCPHGHDHVFTEAPSKVLARGPDRACPYCNLRAVSTDNCVAATHPHIAKEWHESKNGRHVPGPNSVVSTAKAAVWFRCSIDPRHEWRAIIANRCAGETCPFCSGAVATQYTNLLIALGRDTIKYFFHPTKNVQIPPETILSSDNIILYLLDPLTGYEFSTSPSDLTDVARQKTFGTPIEAISTHYVPRSLRAKALNLIRIAASRVFDATLERLIDLATRTCGENGFIDHEDLPPHLIHIPKPRRSLRSQRAGRRPSNEHNVTVENNLELDPTVETFCKNSNNTIDEDELLPAASTKDDTHIKIISASRRRRVLPTFMRRPSSKRPTSPSSIGDHPNDALLFDLANSSSVSFTAKASSLYPQEVDSSYARIKTETEFKNKSAACIIL